MPNTPGIYKGAIPLPIGVWTKIEPDARGLRVEGKLIPLTAHYVRRIHSLLKEGALRGLSIAYHAPPGGAIYKRKAGEPKRLLKAVELHSIDIVRDTSNSEAQIDGAERRNRQSDH
jgi:HK97 family phage prohead protease